MDMKTVMALLLVCVFAGLAVVPVPHVALGSKHHRTTSELLRSSGYPSEVHHVTTKDGYVLELDRIPRPGRPVVYLANQIYGSAVAYLVLGKGRALGKILIFSYTITRKCG
ncbi:hypothetical protein FOCC_FOCC006557 [Frankliniella occidentalis]|nr:hypothetical protein FOCC_FOCC006557 [Frankliniella occidentalis]